MFQEFSRRVDKLYYKAAVEKIKSMFSSCDINNSWNASIFETYQECTNEIINSSLKIHQNIKAIESYSLNHNQLTTVQESKDTISTVNIIAKVSSPLVHNVHQVHIRQFASYPSSYCQN